jgi:hypothetical protein
MNSYVSVTELKSLLDITSTTDDSNLRKIAEGVSRTIDKFCNRNFYVTSATKYYDQAGARLWIDDLLSISTLKTDEDSDLDYDNTFADTDYILYPLNTYPKYYIEISNNSDYAGFGAGKKSVQIVGTWGYADSATPYDATSITATVADTTSLTITLSADGTVEIGHTILVGTEQMYVTGTSTGAATVLRGRNGTTASIHAAGAVSIYRYPFDIWNAASKVVTSYYQLRRNHGMKSQTLGDYSYTLSDKMFDKDTIEVLRAYRKVN